eukprot:8039917-Pyramimonas_sp.AAC.1
MARPAAPQPPRAASQVGNIRLVTVSGSCWESVKTFVRSDSESKQFQIACCQETMLLGTAVLDATRRCAKQGWNAVSSEVVKTECGAVIQGTAISIRQGLDLGIVRIDVPSDTPQGGVAAVALEVPGHTHLLSCS